MQSTPNLALPYPEASDNTRTWEYWQNLAEAIDAYAAPTSTSLTSSLASGFTGTPAYYNQYGRIYLTGQIISSTGAATITDGTQLMTLPSGVRPPGLMRTTAAATVTDIPSASVRLTITSAGAVTVNFDSSYKIASVYLSNIGFPLVLTAASASRDEDLDPELRAAR